MNLLANDSLLINDPALLFLVELLIKGSLILFLIVILSWILRGASAACQNRVWLGGLGALLILPFVAGFLPGMPIRFPIPESRSTFVSPVVETTAGVSTETAVPVSAERLVSVAPEVGQNAQSGRPQVGAWLWFAGGLLATMSLASAFLQLRRRCRKLTPVDSREWEALLAESRASLGLKRSVRLLVAPTDSMPMTWGVFRPVILLPAKARTWPDSLRKAVLLHELAHIKRNDYLFHVMSRLICAIHWFNPLVWYVHFQVLRTREQACDDLVLLVGSAKPSDYAGHLLAIAKEFRAGSLAMSGALPMARTSALERRVLAILGNTHRQRRTSRKSAFAISLVSLCLALTIGVITPVTAASEDVDDEQRETITEADAGPDQSDLDRSAEIDRIADRDPISQYVTESQGGAAAGSVSSARSALWRELQEAERRLAALRERYRERHPAVLTLQNEIAVLQRQVDAIVQFTVLGQVNRPGVYEMNRGASILEALGHAQGWTDKARLSRVLILRGTDKLMVNVSQMIDSRQTGAQETIQNGDVIFVEEALF